MLFKKLNIASGNFSEETDSVIPRIGFVDWRVDYKVTEDGWIENMAQYEDHNPNITLHTLATKDSDETRVLFENAFNFYSENVNRLEIRMRQPLNKFRHEKLQDALQSSNQEKVEKFISKFELANDDSISKQCSLTNIALLPWGVSGVGFTLLTFDCGWHVGVGGDGYLFYKDKFISYGDPVHFTMCESDSELLEYATSQQRLWRDHGLHFDIEL